jgi:glycosyltransferase involved in cell wall biosynthesis
LRIVVDARIRSGMLGGIEGVLTGLASGLAALTDSDEEYVFLCLAGEESFLAPVLGPNSRVAYIDRPPPAPLGQRIGRRARRFLSRPTEADPVLDPNVPPPSDGTVERLEADLVHFTSQAAFLTRIPTIYHPHDIQHVHLPEFFSSELIAWREGWYRALCEQASMVAVSSAWTKRDVEEHYGLPPGRVRVVPLAPVTSAFRRLDAEEARAIRDQLGVPDTYVLYPAQTWPHKNHVGLLRALALLRDRHDVIVPLVAPGQQNEHFDEIKRVQASLGLDAQVTWPGFVSAEELRALYAGATSVVIPTRFEAASFPLWEAFEAGVPAACSNVTSLPEQAGDAALVFDPDDVDSIASAILRLWSDDRLRTMLAEHGRERIKCLTWERTARIFRAHYRRLTSTPLRADDRELLAAADPTDHAAPGAIGLSR